MEDFGIKEVNEVIRSGGNLTDPTQGIHDLEEMEALRNKVADEALHSALRIAGLVSRPQRCP